MADIYLVKINDDILRRNLTNAGEQMTDSEIIAWLQEADWQLRDDGLWLVAGLSLELLDRSEFDVVERVA